MEQEAQWISEIKKENKQAFKSVYDQYTEKVFYVALHFYLDQEEAKEIVQEVFLTLWEKRSSLKEHLSLNAFLLTITKNRILNLHKKKAAELERAQTYMQYHDASSSSTEDYVIFNDLEKYANSFIEALPARQKRIYLLSRKEAFTNNEISHHLNISKRTVENNIYQAEKAIRSFQDHASQPPHPISYISKQTTRGEKRTILLNDGTVVKLNADSRLWYSQAFGQDSVREVYLDGEAFFDMARDTLHPFQIHTGSVTTTVLGTSFNVQAFAPDEEIAVSVVSGKVKVTQQDTPHEQMVCLLPGDQAVYSKADAVITKKKFDYQEILSWKDGTLYFKNAVFSDIVITLERWYGVEIEVRRQGIEDGFSGAYTHKSLESVLKGVSFVLNFDYEIHGRKIIIK